MSGYSCVRGKGGIEEVRIYEGIDISEGEDVVQGYVIKWIASLGYRGNWSWSVRNSDGRTEGEEHVMCN